MLTLLGDRHHFCDRLSRRNFLQIGGLALGGLSLPEILRAEAESGTGNSHKAVIMIYLPGGPPHQDMYDLKPEAPQAIRGEFSPIHTNIPGIDICEHMPRLAARMDKFAVIRSLVGSRGRHASFQCVSGHDERGQPLGGWPGIGSVVSKLQGPVDRAVPPAVDLSMKMGHQPYNLPGPGFLGMAHAPFRPEKDAMNDMVLGGVSVDRLHNRQELLSGLDRFRRNADAGGMMDGMDAFTQRAFDVLTSSKLVEALDLEREDPKTRARYGTDDPKALPYGHLGYQAIMSKFLIARRIVEAGVRCVTVSFADFDWHGANFVRGKKVLPLFDQGISALVDDLHARGMERDVTVIAWGEFGRTPRINKNAGRDHWPGVSSALLACGGMRTGQVIGSTSRLAESAVDRPVHYQNVFSTLYHHLGIETQSPRLLDLNGRPQYVIGDRPPVKELL